jgi:CBS domain-containing protein
MVNQPKTVPVTATVGEVRRAFESRHVHMVLVVERGRLVAAVEREDVDEDALADSVATGLGRLAGRTIGPDAASDAALHHMKQTSRRRLAVVDDAGMLLGLLCLKRSGTGFCSDTDVMARAAESQSSSSIDRLLCADRPTRNGAGGLAAENALPEGAAGPPGV